MATYTERDLMKSIIMESADGGATWRPNTAPFSKGPLAMSSLLIAGHSFTDPMAGVVGSGVYRPDHSMIRRALQSLGLQEDQVRHLGVSGGAVLAHDGYTFSSINYGTGGWYNIIRDINPRRSAAPQEGGTPPVFFCWGINDVNLWGFDSPDLAHFQVALEHAFRTLISRVRCVHVYEQDSATVVLGGAGWTTGIVNTTASSLGTYARTATNGNTATITVPSWFEGGTVVFGTWTHPTLNGTWTFTVDGVAAGSINTAEDRVDNGTAVISPICKRFTGLSAGAHTIVATASNITGALPFDWWGIESRTMHNPVVLATCPHYPSYSNPSGSDEAVDAYNTALDTMVDEFENVGIADIGRVMDTDLGIAASTDDGLHPGEAGSADCAAEIRRAFQSLSVGEADFSTTSRSFDGAALPLHRIRKLSGVSTYIHQAGIAGAPVAAAITFRRIYWIPISVTTPCFIDSMVVECSASAVGGTLRSAIYHDHHGYPTYRLHGSDFTAAFGVGVLFMVQPGGAASDWVQIPYVGRYWMALSLDNASGTPSIYRTNVGATELIGRQTVSLTLSGGPQACITQTASYAGGTLPNSPFVTGATMSGETSSPFLFARVVNLA